MLEPEAKTETGVAGPGWACFECHRVCRQQDVNWEADHSKFREERGYVDGGVDPDEEACDPSVIGVNELVANLMLRRLFGVADREQLPTVGIGRCGTSVTTSK